VVLEGRVKMGAKNRIGIGAVIGADRRIWLIRGPKSGVVMGEGNVIREYVTIHRGTEEGTDTVIGNGVFFMVGAHVAHNCRLADGGVRQQRPIGAGYVEVEEKAFLGGAVVVHRLVRIGKLAMVRGRDPGGDGPASLLHGGGDQRGVWFECGGVTPGRGGTREPQGPAAGI
jgi:UDP-N-acetylglucosamine acyltransferase